MRTAVAVLAPLVALAACTDPMPPGGGGGPATPTELAQLQLDPAPDADGRIRSSVRIRLDLARGVPASVARPGRVLLIAGGADPSELADLTHGRPRAALRAREVPLFVWTEPGRVWLQPARLSAGRHTLVLLLDRRSPFTAELVVDDTLVPASRVWPLDGVAARTDEAWTFCPGPPSLGALPERVALAPSGATMRVVRRSDAPCVELVPESPLPVGTHVPPPALGDWALDPAPIAIDPSPRAPLPAAECREGDVAFGPLCVRVDDDRITLLGAASPTLLLGAVADRPLYAALDAGGRVVVRGLPLRATVGVDLAVRDGAAETPMHAALTLATPHRHVVVNEVLAHAPSGSPSQRFVELVNDADRPASLSGLMLLDGVNSFALPAASLAPGAFVLITPPTFVEGLGGDPAPAPGTVRLAVDALKLSGEVAITEDDGRVRSWFPASSATRAVSRGRRTPDRADDDPDAFGFDAHGGATPGAPNEIE